MKRSLLVLVGLALVGGSLWAASVASSAPVIRTEAMAPGLLSLPRATPAGQTSTYGHIASLSRKQGRWLMRFDPALLLRGATAAQVALEDTGSSDVPNDSVTLDESHRLLTYVVSPTGDRHGPPAGAPTDRDPGLGAGADHAGQQPQAPGAVRSR